MSDKNIECIEISRRNVELNGVNCVSTMLSDGFNYIQDSDFKLILSNPPYHSDFSVPKHFIEKSFNRIQIGGKMFTFTKRKDWYKKKLKAIFGVVTINKIAGYFMFCSEKKIINYLKQ
jgi:16S rRNA (guanine1207-N2)-methyltransferase